MVWYFNFCSPALPNDPLIELNRFLQAGSVLSLMVLCAIVIIYYKMSAQVPTDQDETQSKSNSDNLSDNGKNEDEDDKSVSIAGGLGADENQSYVTFTSNKKKKKTTDKKKTTKPSEPKNDNLKDIQANFPLVFGHFAIVSAFSAMYSPYTEQSIAIIIYIVFSLVLVFVNSKKLIKTTRVIWALMCLILSFVLMSAMLEVAQANYNKGQGQCFSMNYKALY